MADIIVGAVVGELIKNLLSSDLLNFAKYEGVDSQLKKWTDKLTLIQNVLADAAQKQITQKAVESWLHSLQELAYDIEDVVDDMATEVMKRKLNQELHATTSTSSKLLKLFPACCTNLNPHDMIYGHKMSSKLDEITSRLNDLADQKNNLGLDVNGKSGISSSRTNVQIQQTSLVDKSIVLGREADTEALIAKLLEDEDLNQKVSVMSIVGLGGIGKTTLAKILYNDEKVMAHFELRAWVCVSDEFNVFNISKAILQAIGGRNQEFASLDLLHVALKEKLANKRFLVVLDDVWNEDHSQWELLKSPFLVGSTGSKIIITTRKNKVALVMDSAQPHKPEVLSDEIALSLFAYNALNEQNFDKFPSLKVIAQGIIKKCHGLPLALVALGRVLKIKGTSDFEWEELLNSEIWDIDDGGGILPALKLSYYDLPLHLKQLFTYCSFFPKDYLFDKDELVLLWMAQGFLSQSNGNNNKMESLGRNYFEELTSRSFFQRSTANETKYTMHDLMNDLAISVAGEFFFRLDDKTNENDVNYDFEKFRHFSFVRRPAEYKKFKELHRSRCLRTFLRVGQNYWTDFNTFTLDHVLPDLLPGLLLLRVLSLTYNSITNVPKSIGDLKHLRYLNFSNTLIEQVPEEVSELYNLQSLLVCDCYKLVSLPNSFAKLTNLRHLDMSDTSSLNNTPLGIGRLKSLQTLSKVHIEGGNGFKVSDLKDLLYLEGHLSIKGLDKVIHTQQATDADLKGKKGLVSLDMEWSDVFNDSRNSEVVIQCLRPHNRLKKLKIICYSGMKFPSWFGDTSFDKLTELSLKGCRNCTVLDNVSFLTLEYLEIVDMPDLEKFSICDGDNTIHLREIYIKGCPKLVEVSIRLIQSVEVNVGSSNKKYVKRKVTISDCDSVESFNCCNTVEKLNIKRCSSMTTLQQELPSSLRKVTISDCDSLESFNCINTVEELDIERCSSMTTMQQELPSSLKSLKVEVCKKLVSIGEKDVNVGSSNTESVLKKVILTECESLESYSCPNSVEDLLISGCSSMKSLTMQEVNVGSSSMKAVTREIRIEYCHSLEYYNCPINVDKLEIWYCDSMTSLTFSTTELELPSSLKSLDIQDCKKLVSIGEKDINVGSSNTESVLRKVILWKCESLKSYSCPNSVEYLYINECSSMKSLTMKELNVGSSNMKAVTRVVCIGACHSLEFYDCPISVEELQIVNCDSTTSLTFLTTELELPSSLKFLCFHRCKSLKSFPLLERLQNLTSLKVMWISNCPSLYDCFPCGLWPPNLRELRIGMLKKPLSEFRLQKYPASLVELYLYGDDSGVTSFAMEGDVNTTSTSFLLPPSLTHLIIWNFKDVESITGVVIQLTHLSYLSIHNCPNIKDLPKSTSSLRVKDKRFES